MEGGGYREVYPGVRARVVWCSRSLIVVETALESGAEVPPHSHPSEQVTTVLRGRILLGLEEKERILSEGDYIVVPPGATHWARAIDDSLVIDVNAPLTRDRLELARRLGAECGGPRGS